MDRKRRFVIADPSLKDDRGHHYELTVRITQSALANNMKPVWLCNNHYTLEGQQANVDIVPIFNVSMYDAYRSQKRMHRFFSQKFSHLAVPFYHHFYKLFSTKKTQAYISLAEDLLRALDRLSLKSSDKLLFHTADGMTYAALDKILHEKISHALPIFHVCTPYDPRGIMPNLAKECDLRRIVKRWFKRCIIDRRIFLYAENSLLAEHLSEIWGVTVRPLELPAINFLNIANYSGDDIDRQDEENHRLEVVYLGPARIEKGFHLIPEIVQHTQELLKRETYPQYKVHFTVQSSPQIIGYTAQILKTIERLQSYEKTMVTLVPEILSTGEYFSLLDRAHVVLLPYGVKEYRVRSSGIVAEALSLNKIILATTGTYPASAITHGGGATGSTPLELAQAIVDIIGEMPKYISNARKQGKEYRKRNKIENYVLNCLRAENAT